MAKEQEAGQGEGSEQSTAPDGPTGPIGTLGKTLFRMRLALTRALSSEGSTEPAPALPASEADAEGTAAGEGHAEFSELLGSLGAEPIDTSVLERKEREIAELRANLQMLVPIGDELARVEQQRLAEKAEHEREVAELRQQIALGRSSQEAVVARHIEAVLSNIAELEATEAEAQRSDQAAPAPAAGEGADGSEASERQKQAELELTLEESRAEVCRLSGCLGELSETLAKRNKALERSREALESLRSRLDERKRLASERWHELRALKKRLRELEREGRTGGARADGVSPQ